MLTVGIIGANGQVGSEVALILSEFPNVRVVAICRTRMGSALLRRCGIECRHGKVDHAGASAGLLAGCDMVVDFAIPRGLPSEVRAGYTSILSGALAGAGQGARYVFASSISAFGMPATGAAPMRNYGVSRTAYGAGKRFAEREALRLGRRFGHEIFVLRLGQVHGELQAVSRSLAEFAARNPPVLIPDSSSYTVFAFSIAEAIVNIGSGLMEPAVYTLVSVPPWSWREVYEYYCDRAGVVADIVLEPPMAGDRPGLREIAASAMKGVLRRHAELIAGNLLVHVPWLERRVFNVYKKDDAGVGLAIASRLKRRERPISTGWYGKIPGTVIESISDSRNTMRKANDKTRQRIAAASADLGTLHRQGPSRMQAHIRP